MSVTLDLDLSALNDIVDELGDAIETAARPAAQAGADVLYKEVKRNVAALGKQTGNLDRSIYQVFSQDASRSGVQTYHVSWNARVAPHGHLIENGHLQRYATYIGRDGKWYTAVRQEKQGAPKPRRRASQAEKDAYYILRPGGPVQVAARSFVRKATSAFPAALDAAQAELLKRIAKG